MTTNDPANVNPRARLKELLAIHEYDRTDEQWDEIVELEIQLAPGNRIGAPPIHQSPKPRHTSGHTRGGQGGSGYGGANPHGGSGAGNPQHKARKPKGPFKPKKKPQGPGGQGGGQGGSSGQQGGGNQGSGSGGGTQNREPQRDPS